MTNAEYLRNLSDEKLAEWLGEHDDQWYFCNTACPYNNGIACTMSIQSCEEGRLKWLKQEHEE